MTRDELIKRIKETAYLEGDFVLRSGLMMIVYSGVLGLLERKRIVENILQLRQILRGETWYWHKA